jgi:hypothetical protein
MVLKKNRLEALGLSCMTVLALMGLNASAAQAADVFLENGAAITSLLSASAENDTLAQLEVPLNAIEIDCTTILLSEVDLLGSGVGEGAGISHLKILFSGCQGYSTGGGTLTLQSNCKLYPTALDRTKGTNSGRLLAEGLAEVFLHEKTKLQMEMGEDGTPYVLARGKGPEEVFSEIFTSGCLNIPNGSQIKGLEVFKVTPGATNVEKQLVEMADLALFGNFLLFGEREVLTLGSAWVKLGNSNNWGIC